MHNAPPFPFSKPAHTQRSSLALASPIYGVAISREITRSVTKGLGFVFSLAHLPHHQGHFVYDIMRHRKEEKGAVDHIRLLYAYVASRCFRIQQVDFRSELVPVHGEAAHGAGKHGTFIETQVL